MKKLRILAGILVAFGALLILNSFSGLTGFVVFEGIGKQVGSLIGIVFIVVGIILLGEGLVGLALEEHAARKSRGFIQYNKLKANLAQEERHGESFLSQIIRSDLNRIKKLPKDILKEESYNPNLSFEGNKKKLLRSFYSDNPNPGLEINDEIREGFRKYLLGHGDNLNENFSPEKFYGKDKPKEIQKRFWKNTKRKYLNSSDFYKFKKYALKELEKLDKMAIKKEIVPLFTTRSKDADDYPGFENEVIYFGPKDLSGDYREERTQEEEADDPNIGTKIFKYHIIYDPKNKEIGKIPHGHWELNYVGKKLGIKRNY